MLVNISAMARIQDAHTVVTEMGPAVAIARVELGLSLTGGHTAVNLKRGMELLESGELTLESLKENTKAGPRQTIRDEVQGIPESAVG